MQLYAVYMQPTRDPKTNQLKVNRWKKIFPKNKNQRKGVFIIISENYILKQKNYKRQILYYVIIKILI